jgi:hypothetical protein
MLAGLPLLPHAFINDEQVSTYVHALGHKIADYPVQIPRHPAMPILNGGEKPTMFHLFAEGT